MDLVCVVLSLPMPDDRCTLPTFAPIARAFCSLLTLRVSMARKAAAVLYLVALSSNPDFPVSFVVAALLCRTPITVVSCRHPRICPNSVFPIAAHVPTYVPAVLMRSTLHQHLLRPDDVILASAYILCNTVTASARS